MRVNAALLDPCTANPCSSRWLGPYHTEARAAYARARNAGYSPFRALVLGTIASFKDAWVFRGTIAKWIGCSVRTVQRAITTGKVDGFVSVYRAKKNEKAPGIEKELPCGWSHRFTVGWGLAGAAVKAAVEAARAARLVKAVLRAATPRAETEGGSALKLRGVTARPEYQRRTWTAEELDTELERLERARKPPD